MASQRSSIAQNVALLAGSLLVTLLLFGIIEGVLRVLDIGDSDASKTSRLKYQQIGFPTLLEDERPDGTPVWRTHDPRLPFQEILRDKPEEGLRILTFGGSATAGLGYSPNVTFSRRLEQMLEAALPDREIEVMNLGIVALSSNQVVLLVEEAARTYDPDALVVYSGNNEFLEVHAEKYAEANATALSSARDFALDTNLFRVVNGAIRGEATQASPAEMEFSQDDLKLTQAHIIEDIEMTPQEIGEVVDRYESNLDRMQSAAGEHDIPLVLMTVASNWEWRGRKDLPENWASELLGSEGDAAPERLALLRSRIEEELASAPVDRRYEWLFKRALVERQQGDMEAARTDFRAAMNEDPHLRRALDTMGQRVLDVAQRGPAVGLDTIDFLSSRADSQIVGFDHFYDYVHFTPKGAVLVAKLLFETLRDEGIVDENNAFDTDAFEMQSFEETDTADRDFFAVDTWMGTGIEPERTPNRDLWKYDRMKKDLDKRLDEDPEELAALVYRANASYFEIGGAPRAEALYLQALELSPDHPDIQANLERLRTQARP